MTLGPLANGDVHVQNGMTSFQTLQNSISDYIIDGLQRPKCYHGKMFDSISFFSTCPRGIVVVVFHFDSGGRKAKQKVVPSLSSDLLSLPTLQLLPLLPACCSKTPLRQDFPQVCPGVRHLHGICTTYSVGRMIFMPRPCRTCMVLLLVSRRLTNVSSWTSETCCQPPARFPQKITGPNVCVIWVKTMHDSVMQFSLCNWTCIRRSWVRSPSSISVFWEQCVHMVK